MPLESMMSLAKAMSSAAQAVLEVLEPEQREAVRGPFPAEEHRRWTYLPGRRPGVLLSELTAAQREPVWALLHTAYSPRGVTDLQLVVRVEEVRRELDAGPATGAAGHVHRAQTAPPYWLRFLGEPGTDRWFWKVSGHHLVAQATIVAGSVAITPQFLGAEPAVVPSGPHAGLTALPYEQDLARELVSTLQEDQRAVAVAAAVAPDDILTRHDPAVRGFDPVGLRRSGMDRPQAELLDALVRQYLDRAPAPVADQAWTDLLDAGRDEVRFTWSGPLDRGEGHYYAVSGPTFLLEYDNTQDGANHIHCVWRDLRRDFGQDVLAQHYAAGHADGPPE